MKNLNLAYDTNTSEEVEDLIEDINRLSADEIYEKYSVDDVDEFLELLRKDYDTLLNEEEEMNWMSKTDDWSEEYAMNYHFI